MLLEKVIGKINKINKIKMLKLTVNPCSFQTPTERTQDGDFPLKDSLERLRV